MDAVLRCGGGAIVVRCGLAGKNRCFRKRYIKNGGMAENKTSSSNRPISRLCSFTVMFAFARKPGSPPGKLSTKELVFWDFCCGGGMDTKEVDRYKLSLGASFSQD
jgi:hypothetical protein